MEKFYFTQGVEITIIGISVVFAGLILTFFMINLFSIIPGLFIHFKRKEDKKKRDRSITSHGEIKKEHLAIIVTVLDIEFKMRSLLDKGKFTFK